VNGVVVTEMGVKVDPEVDSIEVDRRGVSKVVARAQVLALNKPVASLPTRGDGEGESVMNLIRGTSWPLEMNPVGRLDKDSSGLLLMTNDGVLGYATVNPRSHLEKEYEVNLVAPALPGQLKRMGEGLTWTATAPVWVIKPVNNTRFHMIIHRGPQQADPAHGREGRPVKWASSGACASAGEARRPARRPVA